MTVKELKEKLNEYPDTMEIRINTGSYAVLLKNIVLEYGEKSKKDCIFHTQNKEDYNNMKNSDGTDFHKEKLTRKIITLYWR